MAPETGGVPLESFMTRVFKEERGAWVSPIDSKSVISATIKDDLSSPALCLGFSCRLKRETAETKLDCQWVRKGQRGLGLISTKVNIDAHGGGRRKLKGRSLKKRGQLALVVDPAVVTGRQRLLFSTDNCGG